MAGNVTALFDAGAVSASWHLLYDPATMGQTLSAGAGSQVRPVLLRLSGDSEPRSARPAFGVGRPF